MHGPRDLRNLPTLRQILETRRKAAEELIKQGKTIEAENAMREVVGIPPRKPK